MRKLRSGGGETLSERSWEFKLATPHFRLFRSRGNPLRCAEDTESEAAYVTVSI